MYVDCPQLWTLVEVLLMGAQLSRHTYWVISVRLKLVPGSA